MEKNVFIGYDTREDIAYQVCEYSINKKSSNTITHPLKQEELRKKNFYWRGEDKLASTEFTFTRFLVPALMQYKGWSLFCDSDIIFLDDIKNLLRSGADKVSINTAAVENLEFVRSASEKFGSQCIVVAIDAKRVNENEEKWEVVTYGGRNKTGLDVVEWAQKLQEFGAGEILLTSMDRDGTKEGFDNKLTKAVSSSINLPVIASGGVGSLQDLVDGVLLGGAEAVLAASIFHFSEYSIEEAKEALRAAKIVVRD